MRCPRCDREGAYLRFKTGDLACPKCGFVGEPDTILPEDEKIHIVPKHAISQPLPANVKMISKEQGTFITCNCGDAKPGEPDINGHIWCANCGNSITDK